MCCVGVVLCSHALHKVERCNILDCYMLYQSTQSSNGTRFSISTTLAGSCCSTASAHTVVWGMPTPVLPSFNYILMNGFSSTNPASHHMAGARGVVVAGGVGWGGGGACPLAAVGSTARPCCMLLLVNRPNTGHMIGSYWYSMVWPSADWLQAASQYLSITRRQQALDVHNN